MKYFITFTGLDLKGYYTGHGGMVSYDYGECNNGDIALTFETREEAEDWCKHAEDYGWNAHRVEFKVWSYDDPSPARYV